jgi:hypothetical protein
MAGSTLAPFEALLGVAVFFPLTFAGGLLPLAVNRLLGGKVKIVRIGLGPILRQRPVGRGAILQIRAVPIMYQGTAFLSRADRAYRDQRVLYAARLLGLLIAAGVAAVLLPHWIRLVPIAMALAATGLDLASPHKALGRSRLAWLLGASKRRETLPAHLAQHALHAANAGDFTEAERLEAVLREQYDRQDLADLVAWTILLSRGDPREILAGGAPLPPNPPQEAGESRLDLTAAVLRSYFAYLAIEADPGCREAVSGYFLPAGWRTPEILSEELSHDLLIVDALERGDVAGASALNRENLRTTRPTRPGLADDWCTQARIETMLGREREAAKALKRARRLAPWYPRIGVVGEPGAVGGNATPILPGPSGPAEDTKQARG